VNCFKGKVKTRRVNYSHSCEDPRLGGHATLGEKGCLHQVVSDPEKKIEFVLCVLGKV